MQGKARFLDMTFLSGLAIGFTLACLMCTAALVVVLHCLEKFDGETGL